MRPSPLLRLATGLLAAGLGAAAALVAADWPADGQHALVDLADVDAMAAEAPPPAYRQELLTLHRSLVEIPSQSGAEGDVGTWLASYLAARGYRTAKQALPARNNTSAAGRFNVIAWPGGEAGAAEEPGEAGWEGMKTPPLLVTSHIDVVPPHIPYSIDAPSLAAATRATVVRGRGSVDAKGSVAAQVTAVEVLRRAGKLGAGDVLLLFVVGEEDTGDGMKAFSQLAERKTRPDFAAAIFGEPTEAKLACGHKGILGCTVRAAGRAGHSGYPWLGRSANALLVRGLAAVLDADLGASPVYGNTTVNVGVLAGGVAANVIAASASAQLAVRVALGPQATGHEVVRARIAAILDAVDDEGGGFDLSCTHGYGVVDCDCAVPGFDTITVNYGTDVPNLAGNHTRYLYGPGDILVAHSDHEALTVGDLETAVEGYKALIEHVLGV